MPRFAHRAALAAACCALLGTGVGCTDDEPQAPAPGTGTGARGGGMPPNRVDSGRPPVTDNDASTDDDGGGAGGRGGAGTGGRSGAGGSGGSGGSAAPVPPLASECMTIDPAKFVGEDPTVEVLASTASPLDFEVTRVSATWEPGCDEPTIRVDLSDGVCPNGRDHRLSFWFAANAIEAGAIRLGLNSVQPEPDNLGIRIRYTRPSRLDPEGVWGTCRGATATINFVGPAPDTTVFSDLEVSRFFLELTACDGATEGLQTVEGSFKVELQRGLSEICP